MLNNEESLSMLDLQERAEKIYFRYGCEDGMLALEDFCSDMFDMKSLQRRLWYIEFRERIKKRNQDIADANNTPGTQADERQYKQAQ